MGEVLGISRAAAYELVRSKGFPHMRIGTRILVPRDKFPAWIDEQTEVGEYTVGTWMDEWFENVAKIKVRPSSHQTHKGYIDNHIKPCIGNIPLE